MLIQYFVNGKFDAQNVCLFQTIIAWERTVFLSLCYGYKTNFKEKNVVQETDLIPVTRTSELAWA